MKKLFFHLFDIIDEAVELKKQVDKRLEENSK
ncbi:hypothetical protein SAMN05192534_11833 [Alteribacillus persepolensis]|uniref:Uncharacterized protein n=1 Tax=Alteribacillus persepolensis TaxID=568899 RepID=A0A1G8H378_9BACI|nr:hypothetical protein SAMN05192534_11833 [Alteribacillus persepolensis]